MRPILIPSPVANGPFVVAIVSSCLLLCGLEKCRGGRGKRERRNKGGREEERIGEEREEGWAHACVRERNEGANGICE